jgi:tartrate dehydrogenase/decarboxylase/D-malate dehydrogenase
MVFWDEIFDSMKKEYIDVETESLMVDAASMYMVRDPNRFEVVVASNLFGDILTDLGAAISGGMGLAAGANINPEREFPSMFEAIHGSAPRVAGKFIANPIATIWAVAQMLGFLGYDNWCNIILGAVENTLREGKIRTYDLGGDSKTYEVGNEIIYQMKRIMN